MSWETSNRRARLPKDWHRRRAIAAREAGGICQWVTDGVRCTAPGTDCDHIDRDGGDEPNNLRWLCRPHHNVHTAAQAHASWKARRYRPEEDHPGAI